MTSINFTPIDFLIKKYRFLHAPAGFIGISKEAEALIPKEEAAAEMQEVVEHKPE
ncbi:hypothetical protein HY041_04295, partial [Candidatus Roizmanbacteria bacterium]|nr:hypothetical protein [Candidatus Roizmanbacteria bacterium]